LAVTLVVERPLLTWHVISTHRSAFLVAMWFVYVLISSLTVIKAEDQLRDYGCIK
jgi:hypothetical protein